MNLENRPPKEGINASDENPLKEFVWLLLGAGTALVLAVVVIALLAERLAPLLPYRYEARLAAVVDLAAPPAAPSARAVQVELQALADRLVRHMQMPAGLTVRVGYKDDPTVNAFASLGGQVVFFRGLLERLDSEDALAMVMAHELAHLEGRHPAAALGRGVGIGILLSAVSVDLGRSAGGDVLGRIGVTTVFAFNREQERYADTLALGVIAAEYGHLGGALDLFGTFQQIPQERPGGASLPQVELLRTHPLTASRVQAVRAWAAARGVGLDGDRRPLPPAVRALKPAAPVR